MSHSLIYFSTNPTDAKVFFAGHLIAQGFFLVWKDREVRLPPFFTASLSEKWEIFYFILTIIFPIGTFYFKKDRE